MPALSTVENQPASGASDAAYGLLELGAGWEDARGVLIVIHGRARQGDELPGLLAGMASRHQLRMLAPVAPELSWYPGRYDAPEGNGPGRAAALAQVDALMRQANARGVDDARIVLVGFSQGACVAAEYVLWGRKRPAGAAIFTGCAMSVPTEAPAGHCKGIHILITSGDGDPWLPVDDLSVTANALEHAGATVTRHIFSGRDHVVRPREIQLLEELIEHLLPQGQ
jgi:phospholipase/carboxylesterase